MKKIILVAVFFISCGGPTQHSDNSPSVSLADVPQTEPETANDTEPARESHAAEPPSRIVDEVTREQLDAILQKGPGYLLAMVQTDAVFRNGRFQGFRVVAFRADLDEALGIRAGDIVQSINGMPVERPEQLLNIFMTLKTADTIEIAYIRDGNGTTATFSVQ